MAKRLSNSSGFKNFLNVKTTKGLVCSIIGILFSVWLYIFACGFLFEKVFKWYTSAMFVIISALVILIGLISYAVFRYIKNIKQK